MTTSEKVNIFHYLNMCVFVVSFCCFLFLFLFSSTNKPLETVFALLTGFFSFLVILNEGKEKRTKFEFEKLTFRMNNIVVGIFLVWASRRRRR